MELKEFVTKWSPSILIGIGVTGVISTTLIGMHQVASIEEAVRQEKEAKCHILADGYESSDVTSDGIKLTPQDYIKVLWKPVLPIVISGSLTITSVILSNRLSIRRQAVLASAYSIAQTALSDYQGKVKEILGPKKEEEIRGEVNQAKIDDNPPITENIIHTKYGETLCLDALTGRYFYSTKEAIDKAINDLNHDLFSENWVSVNQLYYLLGLDTVKLGDSLGWCVDDMIEARYTTNMTPLGKPCLVLDFIVDPKLEYYKDF